MIITVAAQNGRVYTTNVDAAIYVDVSEAINALGSECYSESVTINIIVSVSSYYVNDNEAVNYNENVNIDGITNVISCNINDNYGLYLQEYEGIFVGQTIGFPVLPYPPFYPLKHGIIRNILSNEFGDAYNQTISKEFFYYRADGKRDLGFHCGINIFTLQFPKAPSGFNTSTNLLTENLWAFFRNRLSEGNKPFYIYNPTECNFIIDTTGNSPIGRYLVRLKDPNQVLNKEYYAYRMFNFGGIELIEDRGNNWNVLSSIGVNINDSLIYIDDIDTPIVPKAEGNFSDYVYWDLNEYLDITLRKVM